MVVVPLLASDLPRPWMTLDALMLLELEFR
jgi:hypothetical protein